MRHHLAPAIGGLLACVGTAAAQVNPVNPWHSLPSTSAREVSLSETNSSLSLDGLVVNRLQGDATNPLLSFSLAPGERIVGLDWSLLLESSGSGVLSDLRLALYGVGANGSVGDGVVIRPAGGINFSGSFRVQDEWLGLSGTDGVLDLDDLGLDFTAGNDGWVYVELYSVYQNANIRLGGNSTIRVLTDAVPTPGVGVALGAFGLLSTRRRRR
ncbi:MAG: hypothetical protein ACF8Q5_06370 [Phycisphaerales bacterium JB040]